MFKPYEFLIAWRYLRARRAEGGISVMTWISLIGIALAVFALIATLAVRSGFRYEFVDTIVGANPHVTILPGSDEPFTDFEARAERLAAVPGVLDAAPVIEGQVMASTPGRNVGVQVIGIRAEDLARIPRVADPEQAQGSLDGFAGETVAIGAGVARSLGVAADGVIRLISPEGVRTAFGTSPRVKAYPASYVFQVGRYDIDAVRVYMPLAEAQVYFNRPDAVDAIHVTLADPEAVADMMGPLARAAGDDVYLWTWMDASGAFLQALRMEDNVMFVILSILVLIAALNITSGLVMLVKNKGRDVGILRTLGLSEGSILRVFFLCGASIGVAGTVLGVTLGCLFAVYIDPIFGLIDGLMGGGAWDPSVRYLSALPARLEAGDVASAVLLSLGLSFAVTILPARRAARLSPVEALRYE